MKRKQGLFTLVMIFCLVWGIASTALAEYNLSFEVTRNGTDPVTDFYRGDYLILNVVVDTTTDLAGCAFTVTYPSDVLTAPATDADGLPVTPGEITSPFPFSYNSNDTHRENASEPGKIYFAGAAIDPLDGGAIDGASDCLFTITFQVKGDAVFGDYQFGLEQTQLFNPDAGYGTDSNDNGVYDEGTDDTKDTVPLLVGAVDDEDPNWENLTLAFPVLLDALAEPVTSPFNIGEAPDSDGDGLNDFVETGTGIYVDENNTGTYPDNPDSDGDGLNDGEEVNTYQTNPCLADTDGDGIDDGWQVYYDAIAGGAGIGSASDDYDGDGYSNLNEYNIGSDPTDPNDPGQHFAVPTVTPTSMDIYGVITNAADQAIADGDEVAAFVSDGQGDLLLVGFGLYGENVPGSYGLIHVYGDDTTTTEKDGAQAGEAIILKAFNKNENKEYPLALVSGDNTWSDGDSREIDWKYLTKQVIPLHSGWNLISFGVNKCYYIGTQPTVAMIEGIEYEEVTSINDILSSISGQYSYVRGFDATGAKSYNLTPFSDMKYMAAGYGYWIKVNSDADFDENGFIYLELEGARVPENNMIPLNESWNLVGYFGNKVQYIMSEPTVHFPADREMYHIDTDDVADIFSSINGSYSYVRGFDETGAKSYNLTPFSDLKYVGPGYGYWIKVNPGESPNLIWCNQ